MLGILERGSADISLLVLAQPARRSGYQPEVTFTAV